MMSVECDALFEADAPPPPVVRASCLAQRGGHRIASVRAAPEETAVAFTFNGLTHAVMMATPADFEDFAVGFAFTEGLIDSADEISSLEIVPTQLGVELRAWLPADKARDYASRRRSMAGPTGCGLCGVESLEAAVRHAPAVPAGPVFSAAQVSAAMQALPGAQPLNAQTHAVHAAGFWTPAEGMIAVREDIGRHNALDKLAGALLRRGVGAGQGLILLTSRVSIELIQKAARIMAPAVVAVSAPTGAAIRLAESCGITLVAVARGGDFETFTHPERMIE